MLAKALYYAMKGLGTNDRVLIEVLTCLWNDEMRAVSEAYTKGGERVMVHLFFVIRIYQRIQF